MKERRGEIREGKRTMFSRGWTAQLVLMPTGFRISGGMARLSLNCVNVNKDSLTRLMFLCIMNNIERDKCQTENGWGKDNTEGDTNGSLDSDGI